MPATAIQIENVWKQYRLGVLGHGSLARDLQTWWARRRGREDPNAKIGAAPAAAASGDQNRFWALQDVRLEVRRGQVLGIIGRNGAGKSTLLKILSRITAPTRGRVRIRGRIASLLEVGTGFHPELTGRENIFLNGAIMGMRRAEIHRKLDEIIAFAEIAPFIDTPVKRYSSGMYVRLAFAVAAHLEPEILVVDEVLAVGDAVFQCKCLGKMASVAGAGRTVLFVSHNMGAVRQLCPQSMWLDGGRIRAVGDSCGVIAEYLQEGEPESRHIRRWPDTDAPGNEAARLVEIRMCTADGKARARFGTDEAIAVEARYRLNRSLSRFRIGFSLHTAGGDYLFYSADDDCPAYAGQPRPVGCYTSRCTIPKQLLNSGRYSLGISGGRFGIETIFANVPLLHFSVHPSGGPTSRFSEPRRGFFAPALDWVLTRTPLEAQDHARTMDNVR